MKKSNFLYTLLFCCMLSLFSSCDKLFYQNRIGHSIKFSATVERRDGTLTRTSYSGEILPDGKEKIYWKNGDQVSIYMDWDDGSGYTGNPEHGIYNVNPGSDFHPNDLRYGRISNAGGKVLKWHGDFSGDDGRAHEYPHTFYSAYPSNGIKKFDGTNVTFNIPDKQYGVNMDYAYMTAYAPNVNSNTNGDSHVELYYYPRVTTLYIAVENDTDDTVGGEIKLTSSNSHITGNFTVDITNSDSAEIENNDGGKEIINEIKTLNKENSDVIAFFIRPRTYYSGELSLTFNGKTQTLDKVFKPNCKYNIKITVSGQIEITEVPDVVAQMILIFLRRKDGNSCYSLFEEFFKQYYGYNDANSFNNSKDFNGQSWWNNFLNKHWADANNTGKWSDALTNLFSENTIKEGALQAFLNELQSITDLDLNDGSSKLTCNFDDKTNLSKYFPNLETLNINVESTIDIYLTDFKKLTTVIVNGNNGNVKIHITGNGQNVTVKRGGGNTTYIINGEELSKDAGATKIVNAQPK